MQVICIYFYLLSMLIDALIASLLVAAASLVGALFFGSSATVAKSERYLIPLTVGVFLSLALFELIPETLITAPELGGLAVMLGFVGFYVLSNVLHKHYHNQDAEDCDKKSAATLVLIGDAVHNLADGFILGGAFLVDPAVGVAVAFGLALHEIPQEIVEFGVLMRAGFTRTQAAIRNLISASSIVLGTIIIILIAEHADEYVWILTGFAAGNLLFLAASDLLPRIHGNLKEYGGIVRPAVAIMVGFVVMSSVIHYTHEEFGHGHEHGEEHHDEAGHVEEDTQHVEDHTDGQVPTEYFETVPHAEDGHIHDGEADHTHEMEIIQ
jgi:zinc and cadmium transporter